MTQEVTENLNNSTANKETTSSNFILYKILLINKLLNPYFKISPKRKLQDKTDFSLNSDAKTLHQNLRKDSLCVHNVKNRNQSSSKSNPKIYIKHHN